MIISPECVAPTGCLNGQSPLWSHAEGFLWWVDQKRAKLHRYNPRTGNTRRYELPVRPSRIALFRPGLARTASTTTTSVPHPNMSMAKD
jgi:xylono-1,5-lactonase